MQKYFLMAVLMMSAACAFPANHVTQKDEIQKTLQFKDPASVTKEILVDNINGSINVEGYDGDVVQLVVHKSINADTDRKLEEAKANITLDITEEQDRILLYVNTPWRCADGSSNYRGREYYGYDVQYDFEIKVPRKVNAILKTVNDGEIRVKGIEGEFTVRNVNGNIEMANIGGSGNVSTVNGDVTVAFLKNPTEPSSFKTVNGKVDVKFQEGLSADLRLKTFNGEAYTDFAVEPLPSRPPTAKRSKHLNVYRGGEFALVRVGRGGPELSFDTLNGDIYIARND